MLRFKYLFENYDLARQAVAYYHHDDISLFEHFRISSNMIYPFKNNHQVFFIRLTPIDEVKERYFLGEIDLLNKLSDYNACRIYQTKDGQDYKVINTKWGKYYLVAFERVDGKRLDELEITDDIAFKVGQSLAVFHELQIQVDRPNIVSILECMEETFIYLNDQKALAILNKLESDFTGLEISHKNYGLIHYDFEEDNLFYDKTIHVIDFNDSMYGFYMLDIINVVDSIGHKDAVYMGYQSIRSIEATNQSWCKRFKSLYAYMRMKKASFDHLEDEPDWMNGLRKKFQNRYEDLLKASE